MRSERGLPGVEAAAHHCGPLCTAGEHRDVLWLARGRPAALAAMVRVEYLVAGIRLTVNAPAPAGVVATAGRRRPTRTSVAWLAGWPA